MEIKNVEMKTNDFQSLINAQNDMAQIFKQVQHEEKPKIKPQQDELQQARLQKLQRQFDELYNKDEEENIKTMVNEIKKTDRQKLIKRLLKELNTDTNQNAYKAEGRF